MNVLAAGTVAIDDVKTPTITRTGLMGGSGAYAAMAASFFAPARVVGIVGKDFPAEHIETLKNRGVCVDGIEHSDGDSFYWSGEYHENMDDRTTHAVAVNVLEAYEPKLPDSYKDSEIVVLANMSPRNQLDVLGQCSGSKFTIADTMDIWIQAERADLMELLGKIDMLVINESEAKLFMETRNLVKAGRKLLELGPKFVIVKTGEHGAMLFGKGEHEFFRTGAYPLEAVEDPTGAGDCFLGGLAGALAATGKDEIGFDDLKASIANGTVIASYNCESFSVEGLIDLTDEQVAERLALFKRYTQF
jgi:sugar/nucleoside kinase (ribokinase family)